MMSRKEIHGESFGTKKIKDSKDAKEDDRRLVFLKDTPRASLKRSSKKDADTEKEYVHGHTHFLKGGLPCDPAPPPYRLASYGEESVYTLVLLRHGESEWNKENRYTGWCDVDLTSRGVEEARAAGLLMLENNIEIDHCFTSVLKRAGVSANLALTASNQHWVPLTKSWRINERCYGSLQGYHKDSAYKELGIDQELVMQMRRSYDTRPPEMKNSHKFWHGNDRRYKILTPEQLDRTRAESLKDTADRIIPFFEKVVIPAITSGNKCLIVSHANSIRTLIKYIDSISDEDIKSMTIPTGIPLLYRLDKNLKPVDPDIELEFRYLVQAKGFTWATSRKNGFHGIYLGNIDRLQEIQLKRDVTMRDWQRIILRNIAQNLCESEEEEVMEIRQLWWQVYKKISSSKEYSNMILLEKTKDKLEELMTTRHQRYLTLQAYERILSDIHFNQKGKVVEPFVNLSQRMDQLERAQKWYAMQALDLEEEALIK